jgi:GntR family transcriptional repressor for pyruvate dehydrogenase complex
VVVLTPRRTVDLAADHLRGAILDGTWSAGDKLPAERRLAVELGISRLTLRAAISRLEGEGLVRAKQGSGVTVLDYREQAGVALLPHLLERGDLALVRPLLQLRRTLAAEAVAVACERASPADITALTQRAGELAEESDASVLADGNVAFGRAVLRLADNLPMELLFNSVTAAYRAHPGLQAVMLGDADAVRASFGVVVGLIRHGDPAAARETVRAALLALDIATLDRLEA